MCGRFTLKTPVSAIHRQLSLFSLSSNNLVLSRARPRYNIAPNDKVLVIRCADTEAGARKNQANPAVELVEMQWGTVVSSPSHNNKTIINTRVETLTEDPQFRTAPIPQRCLIVADGYYEWKNTEGNKIPHYFYRTDQRLFLFAGIWACRGLAPRTLQDAVDCCTIITRPANKWTAQIHDRMPAMLDMTTGLDWLVNNQTLQEVQQSLKAPPEDWLNMHTVHTRVNRVGFDHSSCVDPVDFHRQNPLF
jgi:putative SOS response-associated peptidase YedK